MQSRWRPIVAVFWAFVHIATGKPHCTLSATTFGFGLTIRAPLSVFSKDLNEYTGFDIDIVHGLAGHTGVQYTLHPSELNHDNPNTSTAYIHTYRQPRPKLLEDNFTYSQPYLASHISCASQKYSASRDPWNFISPFDEDLWYALIGCIAVYGCVWFGLHWGVSMESPSYPEDCERYPICPGGFATSLYDGLCGMLQCWEGTAAANSVRLMQCSYAFLVLVIVATYTANLAAFLSTGKSGFIVPSNDAVKSAEKICVTKDSHHSVHEFGVHGHRIVQVSTGEDGFNAVRNGTCQALCLDDHLLQYALSLQTSCDVQRVDAIKFGMVLRGWIFPPSFKTGTAQADKVCLDEWLMHMTYQGSTTRAAEKWFTTRNCHQDASSGPAPRIKLDAVLGLLYIFAVGIAASVVHQVGLVVYRRRNSSSEGSCDVKHAPPVGAVPATLPSAQLGDGPKMQPSIFRVEVANNS